MFLSTASEETLHTSILRKISEITCLPRLKFLNASNLPLLSTTYLRYYELSTIKYKGVLFPSIVFLIEPSLGICFTFILWTRYSARNFYMHIYVLCTYIYL